MNNIKTFLFGPFLFLYIIIIYFSNGSLLIVEYQAMRRQTNWQKIGSETNDDQPSSLTYAEVKTIVKTKWSNDWKKNHSDYSMEKDAMHSMEREQQKTIFRLRTGHGCLRAHLHKQGKTDSPYCNCGPLAQTPRHVLQDCLSLMDFEKRSSLHLPQ